LLKWPAVEDATTARAGFRQTVEAADRDGRAIVLPGVYDALSARLAADAGYEAIYVTGAGLANSRLGVPDIGLVSFDALLDHVTALADVVDVPLVVDADTGFGNAVTVTRTVRLLERAGAAAIQLEDQVFPKRCGHFEGKEFVSTEEMVSKLRAAADSRRDPNVLLVGRTDARATEGLDAAIARALAYRDAGADVTFVEAPTSVDELRQVGRRIPGPKLANMVEGGATPVLSAAELAELGFSIALFANAALRSAQKAVTATLTELRRTGTTTGVLDQMATWQERQEAVGKSEYDELERRYSS
jgi:2-methylisocitrate lyase-like PEP mutase family enzyme